MSEPLRVVLDRSSKLEFQRAKVTSDAGLLRREPPKQLLDLDSSVSPTQGEQPGNVTRWRLRDSA